MPTFSIQLPDGRTLDAEAPDEATAIAGAKDWHAKNSQPAIPMTPEERTGHTAGKALEGIPILGAYVPQAGAAVSALAHPLTGVGAEGESFGERYAKNLEQEKGISAQMERQSPVLSEVAKGIGGTAALGPLGATALGARLLGLTGRTLPQAIVRGVASGGALNAADTLARGGDPLAGGEMGAAVGAAAPIAGRAISTLAQPITTALRGIMNPAEEASRRVAAAVQRDMRSGTAGLNPQEFQAAQQAGAPVNLMDRGGEVTRDLARSAANTSPEGRAVLNQAIDPRFEGQGDRLTDWLRSTFHYPDVPAQQEALAQLGRTVNRPAYRLAQTAADNRHPGGIWSPELERLTSSPDVVDAMRQSAQRGAGRAVAEGYGGFNPGVTFDNGMVNFRRGPTGVPAYPDLRFWDYSYRNLRDSADAAFRAGKNSEGSALRTQANQLRTELDRMVPEFGEARAGAARFFGANDALEAGQGFAAQKTNIDTRGARQALLRMSPQERQLFQDGFVDNFVQQVRNSPDRRSIMNWVNNSDARRERLQIALGPQRANELEAMLRVENVMDLARPAVQGNSTTARQLAALGMAGGVNFAEGGGSFNADPQALMHAALVYGAMRGHGAINTRVSRQVAELLTSNDPRRLNAGMRILARNSNLLGSLRQTDAALASIAARGALPAVANQ